MRGKWMFGKVVCGLLACVFFVMLVVGFFQGLPKQIMVVILLLHSLFLLLLAFIFSSERNDYTGAEDLQQELAVVRSKAAEEKATMQRALDARERELKSQTEDVERMQKEREDERREVEHLRLELEAAHAEQAQHEDISEFLPPPETDEPEVIDIIRAARDIASEMGSTASAAGIQIRISCAEETLLVRAHPSRIRILFRNIIDNSIKYMSRSGSLFITISTIDDDIFIVLKDTGEGLREEETRHIFELNYQGSNRISGNGLGLTQAKAIVDHYGGTIYGRSSTGEGMGIYIQLPGGKRREEAAQ